MVVVNLSVDLTGSKPKCQETDSQARRQKRWLAVEPTGFSNLRIPYPTPVITNTKFLAVSGSCFGEPIPYPWPSNPAMTGLVSRSAFLLTLDGPPDALDENLSFDRFPDDSPPCIPDCPDAFAKAGAGSNVGGHSIVSTDSNSSESPTCQVTHPLLILAPLECVVEVIE